jgi:hypothetical protein
MSTVLEERMPMIRNYLVEQYGRLSQSAVDAVSQGLKTAISLGIASNEGKAVDFETQTLGGPDTKISEAAGVPSPEQSFQREFKTIEKTQNTELASFAKNVFGQDGFLKSLQERGIIIICKPGESSAARGIIINGSEAGVVGPEYSPSVIEQNTAFSTLNGMEETIMKTLVLQKEFKQFNLPVRA